MSEVKTDSVVNVSGDNDSGIDLSTNDVVAIKTANSERARVDASGNLHVGKTTTGVATAGLSLRGDADVAQFTRSGDAPLDLNRLSSDGDIIHFFKDSSAVGSIGAFGGKLTVNSDGSNLSFATGGVVRMNNDSSQFYPNTDNSLNLGIGSLRWNTLFASNSTINTSDQNEKQQIASLTTAEMTAAKAISKLFKTYKWNDAVASKGDAARTHAGVIAQEVQTAMTDAGLDAADYAFWCSDTWTNDDGTSQTRLGIRYPELLAFVGAATEQRLADLETRVTALENA